MGTDNKTTKQQEKQIEWGGLLNEFLWICAGANRKVLRQCPTEYAKYAGIGGTILFTAILASISGGYAIYKVFADEIFNDSVGGYETDTHAVYISIVFGLIWGLMIFNLDRFMVNTMYSDGTHKITKEEWIGGTPRLILAIFIGIVISTPIELRIFKDKIQAQIIIDQGKAKGKMENKQQNLANEVKDLESQKKANHWRIDSINAEKAKIEDMAYNEATGKGGSGVPGVGIYTKQLEARAKSLENEATRVQKEVEKTDSTLDYRLQELYRQQNEHGRNNEVAANSMKGFAAELTALNEITFGGNDGEENGDDKEPGDFSLSLARIMIMFLFVAIEIIPTLFKLILNSATL